MIPLEEIQSRAKDIGLTHFEHLESDDLIHMVQEREGHTPCFGASWCNLCEREHCFWKEDCRSIGITF